MSSLATHSPVGRLASALRRQAADGGGSIWLLSLCMIALAGTLLGVAHVWSARPLDGGTPMVFWMLVGGFAIAERFVVHLHFRRSAHSMSLAEIPLVFALIFASGRDVVLACALGRLLVLAIDRRLPPIRLAFNLGVFLLGSCVAVLVFHALAGTGSEIDPWVWLAAAAATAANSVLVVVFITAVVSLSEGQLGIGRFAGALRTDLIVAIANTCVGLCAARLVHYDWRTGILLTVPVAGMFLTLRAYAAERERHGRLEFLYETSRALSSSPEIGEALEQLLGRALEAFRVETAEIVFFSPDGADALRTTVRASGPTDRLSPLPVMRTARMRELIWRQPVGAFPTGSGDDPALTAYLDDRGLSGGLFAPLRGEHGTVGAIMVGNPSGVVDRFSDEDLRLFEALAANTSVALHNDRLGQTVWQMQKLQGELEHQASHDPLTDLANRVLFTERVGEALASQARTAVIFIDVNDFKAVNDSFGHAAGDQLLLAISGRLRECIRPGDTLARLGGDEFAVLLGDPTAAREEVDVAERIVTRLDERFSIAGQNLSVGASAGVATGAGGQISAEELVRNADLAMYRAKQDSSGYEMFETGMELPVLRRHGLKQRLRDAVGRNSFEVHYQPIVALHSGETTAHEALVRWLDGPNGCVAPASFIPIAEEMGVIVDIGRQVLRQACADAQLWDGPGSGPAVHVNLSPVELRDPRFVGGVYDALAESGIEPRRLVLEITEGVVLRDPAECIAILEQLRGLGVQLALDDFGTGYSSLSYLRQLPLDWLKIGHPFVEDISSAGANRPFMRMILDLAASLDLGVVAEGVETADQMQSLREMGCGYGQGFLLGRPSLSAPLRASAAA